jgi:hypothetical protein
MFPYSNRHAAPDTHAMRFTGDNHAEIKRFVNNEAIHTTRNEFLLLTERGDIPITEGKWVMRSDDGGRWVVSNESFRSEYILVGRTLVRHRVNS